jgi:hypothetical protein
MKKTGREARLKPAIGIEQPSPPPAEAGGKEEPAEARLKNRRLQNLWKMSKLRSRGVAPGWYEVGPLALGNDDVRRSRGVTPGWYEVGPLALGNDNVRRSRGVAPGWYEAGPLALNAQYAFQRTPPLGRMQPPPTHRQDSTA